VGVTRKKHFTTEVTESTEKTRDKEEKSVSRSLRDRTPYFKFEIGDLRQIRSGGKGFKKRFQHRGRRENQEEKRIRGKW
jgi:hypothetical protein